MRRIHNGWIILSVATSVIILGAATFPAPEAPIGLDNLSNGLTEQATHAANLDQFAEVEDAEEDGLGPLFNDTSCAACHLNGGAIGAGSQVRELRVGYLDDGKFVAPNIRLASPVPPEVVPEVVHNRSLVNQRSICPEAHEIVPENIQVRAERLSISVLGDGFIEAVPDAAILAQRNLRCRLTFGRICGLAVEVPILELEGQTGIGRFGWKAQHRSLLSFSADAYLNEMGITNDLLKDEVATTCNPKDVSEPNNIGDINLFAEFMRATKAPGPDGTLLMRPAAQAGAYLFHRVGCADCHVTTWQTAEVGTTINVGATVNGGPFTIPAALGHKTFHPFTDFLLHDVGTGDGIVQNGGEASRLRIKTPALWGLRIRTEFMHDGRSVTLTDAILQHRREAGDAARRFRELSSHEQQQLLAFLRSL